MSTANTATGTTTTVTDPLVGQLAGTSESLANWAGPYVTNMLGMGQALAQSPYQAYTGPLTAGYTAPQQQAFQGIANLAVPTQQMGTFQPTSFTSEGIAQNYMSPFLQASLEPQLAEAQRQAEIARVAQAGRLSKAGAFGGGRQAIMESELTRNLLRNLSDITGTGYQKAFEQAQQQFNVEQGREMTAQEMANRYGLEALQQQATMGAQERAIEQQAVDAARKQFEEERLFPYKQVQFMQSLLQDLPLEAVDRSYIEPSQLSQFFGNVGGIQSLIDTLFGGAAAANPATQSQAYKIAEEVEQAIPDAGEADLDYLDDPMFNT